MAPSAIGLPVGADDVPVAAGVAFVGVDEAADAGDDVLLELPQAATAKAHKTGTSDSASPRPTLRSCKRKVVSSRVSAESSRLLARESHATPGQATALIDSEMSQLGRAQSRPSRDGDARARRCGPGGLIPKGRELLVGLVHVSDISARPISGDADRARAGRLALTLPAICWAPKGFRRF